MPALPLIPGFFITPITPRHACARRVTFEVLLLLSKILSLLQFCITKSYSCSSGLLSLGPEEDGHQCFLRHNYVNNVHTTAISPYKRRI